MKHRNSHFAVGYWSRIRRGRAVPDQADIDPRALKRLLPFVFLLDARMAGSLTYRLAGTTLCERYGGELRGRNFLSHWDPDSRARIAELLPQALSQRVPACLTSMAATDDYRTVEIETVLMPITFGSALPERFLGVAQVLTEASPLSGRHITLERIVTAMLVREGDNSQPAEPPHMPPEERIHPRAMHLRLVASDTFRKPGPQRFDMEETMRSVLAFCGSAGAHF